MMTTKTDFFAPVSTGSLRQSLRTLLYCALMGSMATPLMAQDIWPQSEDAYRSDKPRAQWLQAPQANKTEPSSTTTQQVTSPTPPALPSFPGGTPQQPAASYPYQGTPTYGIAPSYPSYGSWQSGWPGYGGYAPYAYAPPPAYYPPRPYKRKKKGNHWWPGNGSWPDMNNFSMPDMPSPSFTTPSFSLPANPFGW